MLPHGLDCVRSSSALIHKLQEPLRFGMVLCHWKKCSSTIKACAVSVKARPILHADHRARGIVERIDFNFALQVSVGANWVKIQR